MAKNLFAALLLAVSVTALADTAPAATGSAPAITYTRDANFIYIKQPRRVTLDEEQQDALQKGVQMIQQQLNKLNQSKVDPDGDLQAISDAANEFSGHVDQLVKLGAQLHGEVKAYGPRFFEAMPSAVVVFAGAEYDKNFVKVLQGGGSIMIGAVLVPISVQRISIKNPNDVVNYVEWNSSLIVMPTANIGPGVSTTGGGMNERYGVGLVWGELNDPHELNGLTGGGSMTVEIGAGLNVKMLGLKNMQKPGAINNYLLLVGLERGQLNAGNGKLPLIEMNAESHFNLSWIYDAQSTISGIVKFGKDVADRVSKPSKP